MPSYGIFRIFRINLIRRSSLVSFGDFAISKHRFIFLLDNTTSESKRKSDNLLQFLYKELRFIIIRVC